MPHVIVKLFPGKTEEQKTELATAITNEVVKILGKKEATISVSFEEVSPEEWKEKVYTPDIIAESVKLYKRPGYEM